MRAMKSFKPGLATILCLGTAVAGLPMSAAQSQTAPEPSGAVRVETPLHPDRPASGWDPTEARGRTRTIDFVTTEGTWMSVDIAPDGTLAFDLLGHIYRLPAQGGEARALTQASGAALNYQPSFSPDGRRIAFVSDRSGQDGLWVMDADGANPRPVFLDPDSRIAEPRWMPDGKAIVAVRRLNTAWGTYRSNDTLWIFPVDGGTPHRLTSADPKVEQPSGEYDGMARWQSPAPSEDGRYVYFSSTGFVLPNRRLQRADLTLQRIEPVTESPDNYQAPGRAAGPRLLGETAPRPSPDGRYLAFIRKLPGGGLEIDGQVLRGRSALWLRDLATGEERVAMDPVEADQMLDHPMWKAMPFPSYAWTRDSRSIIIAQGGHIRRLDVASGRVSTIPFRAKVRRVVSEQAIARGRIDSPTFGPHYARSPSLAPGGRTLAIEAAGKIWLKPLDGGAPQPLVANQSPELLERTPAWSPRGDAVAFVTSDGYRDGNLWLARPGGSAPLRVSAEPGRYAAPFWSSDGKSIYVNRWPAALERTRGGTGSFWQLWRYPADRTSAGEQVPSPGDRIDIGFRDDGRIYFTRIKPLPTQGIPQYAATLLSMQPDGSDVRPDFTVHGTPDRIVPSPDLRHVAIQQFQEIWTAPLVRGATIDLLDRGRTDAKRMGTQGGVDPTWTDANTLLFASAGGYVVAPLDQPGTPRRPLGLELPRDIAHGRLAITNARLVTLGAAGTIAHGTLLIENGRIACVGTCDTTTADRVIDAAGKTIIPGLIDVHSHSLIGDSDFVAVQRPRSAIYLAYGVTTIHDPSTKADPSFVIADLVEAGRIVGPRTFSTGWAHDEQGRGWESQLPILSLADARIEADRQAGQGVRSLKDYRIPTRVQRQMFIEAARERGLTVTQEGGEFPLTLGQIIDGGTGWEHPMALYPMYDDLVRFLGLTGAHYSNQMEAVGYPDPSVDYFLADAKVWDDPKLRAWMGWKDLAARRIFGRKPLDEYPFPIVARDMARMRRAGGYTPLGGHSMADGLGMHWELWGLAAGSDPETAIRAATLDGAHFLGLDDQIGSLERGKLADLIVLDANPLDDIRNSLRIRWVMKAGVLRDGATLDQLWPQARPYGSAPWRSPDIFRDDVRKLDQWDRATP